MPTEQECKRMLSSIGFKLGVSPKLIALRLLDQESKQEMLDGVITAVILEAHVKVWMQNGMPDYANGKFEPYKAIERR